MNVTPFAPLNQSRTLTAEVFHAALNLAADGVPVSRIAEELDVPRSTLRDRLTALAECPLPAVLKVALASPDGEAFLKRLAIIMHVELRNTCSCGLRVIENILRLTGLSALIGASVGCQWTFGQLIDEEILAYGEAQTDRMKPALEAREITLACDENFHEGPCLVAMEPASNFIVVEELSDSRSTDAWKSALLPVLATLGVRAVQITSDSGTSILALAEHVLGAGHSPDFFHVLYDFKRALSPAMKTVRKSIEASLLQCEREITDLGRMEERWKQFSPEERGRGRPPDFENSRMAQEKLFSGHMEAMCSFQKCDERIKEALKNLSHSYHPVCLKTGKRMGESAFLAILGDVRGVLADVARELSLPDQAVKALEKFERMTQLMLQTLVSTEKRWRLRAKAASPDHKSRYVLEAFLAPAEYLDRIARKSRQLKAHELDKLAADLRRKASDRVGESKCRDLKSVAVAMADEFQRSSSMVEGRNGHLSLRHHAFHELSPRKRKVLTIIHNFVSRRTDGTTASERLSGLRADDLIDFLCQKIKSYPRAGGRRSGVGKQKAA